MAEDHDKLCALRRMVNQMEDKLPGKEGHQNTVLHKIQQAKRATSLTHLHVPSCEPCCHTAFVDEASLILLECRLQGQAWKTSQPDPLLNLPCAPKHVHMKHLHRADTRRKSFVKDQPSLSFSVKQRKQNMGNPLQF